MAPILDFVAIIINYEVLTQSGGQGRDQLAWLRSSETFFSEPDVVFCSVSLFTGGGAMATLLFKVALCPALILGYFGHDMHFQSST